MVSIAGEVSDSDTDSDSDSDEQFSDGYDDKMRGDEEDRRMLDQMTEVEREKEIFNRLEKREAMKMRYVCEMVEIARSIIANSEFNSQRGILLIVMTVSTHTLIKTDLKLKRSLERRRNERKRKRHDSPMQP